MKVSFILALWLLLANGILAQNVLPAGAPNSGLLYTNYRVASVPWSIHVVRVERTNSSFEYHCLHAGGGALGLDTVSSQLASITEGTPVAAVNGDFYQRRDHNFMGDPRGILISDGELLSAPTEGAAFWMDTNGQPRVGKIESKFHVVWTNGVSVPFGLNEPRLPSTAVLYTPSVGSSTHTVRGRELILEKSGDGPWLPLRIGTTYSARVRAIREEGNSRLEADTMVLSLGAALARKLPALTAGAILEISSATVPGLAGVISAISGGPALVQDGKRQRDFASDQDSFEFSSMTERHPRTAVGWNSRYFFLVEVDGRQQNLSVGMTLEELSGFMAKLNCEQALNLDGGGSSTLWYNGRVRNRPCDGREREVACSLVVVRKKEKAPAKLAMPAVSSPP